MKLLLTGFEPFGALALNPSELVVRALAGRPGIAASAVLPTVYGQAGDRLLALIERERPDLVLMTGVAAKRAEISLERVALNLEDADKPDNAGVRRGGSPIEPGAPLARATTLDLAPPLAALKARGIPAAISNHAGAFVCNHVYYRALGTGVPSLFVHLPMIDGAAWTAAVLSEAVGLVAASYSAATAKRDAAVASLAV